MGKYVSIDAIRECNSREEFESMYEHHSKNMLPHSLSKKACNAPSNTTRYASSKS